MKNIPPTALPHFYVQVCDYPNSYIFEFDILCKSNDYSSDVQKLKLFLATMKNSTLCWFMGLSDGAIKTWDEMRREFLQNHR